MTWNPHERPPPDTCPERFCFHWVPPGGSADLTGRKYDSIEEALSVRDDWTMLPNGGCGCCFGVCTRADPAGDTDWYEPEEQALKQAGLPWFYFVSSVHKLANDFRERYISESTTLWGDHDGLT